ncbi:MAG: type I pullulanase [Ruminococcus sp.]|nr:type I pullulanase [Ruminococcus sp.]
MKLRKLLCALLAAVLLISSLSISAFAEELDLADSGAYYNQNLYENYASKAVNETGLGATYSAASTTFKVWAPEAQSVSVRLYTTGTDSESGAKTIDTKVMTYNSTTGIWSLTLSGDHKDQYYTYLVKRDNVTKETVDPYAKAVGANGDRGMIVDLKSTDPEGWANDKHVLFTNPGEAVVWEIHVRDFSISASSGVSEENRGKYLAFTEGNTTLNGAGQISTCVDYLVEHNINCVQLMPIEDFASVDETSDAAQFNWGYDPKNYNVPDGSYSSDPYNGNTRITEFKMLVQALHDRGISVVMDVVYNHTFVLEGSPLSLTTPKYYYRMSSDKDYCDGSGLGNVLSSEKAMTSKFISDSLCYWANEYHIDGFRFDLMGCHDTTNIAKWRSALDKIDSRILMYGEPWIGGSNNGITNGLSNSNLKNLTRVGAFNENYSDGLKGNHEPASAASGGFVSGGAATEVLKGAGGTSSYLTGAKTNQLINYTDNHDNLILFDKLSAVNKTGIKIGTKDNTLYDKNKTVVNTTNATLLNQMKLALTAALTSQGTPFTVAGTEFCRTKYGEGNSYRSPDNMNSIDWNRASTYKSVADYYAGLAAIRKAVTAFGDGTADAVSTVSGGCTAYQITNNKSGQWNKIIVALNNTSAAKSITLSGSWTVVANGTKAGTASLGNASGSYSVPAYSGVVLVDSSSFGNYTQPAQGTATLTVEHYTRDSASGNYTKVKTQTAKYKEGQTYRASQDLSILFDHNFDRSESTSGATSGKAVAGQNITVKFYYTRYITSGYLTVNFINSNTNTQVRTPMKYHMRDGDPFSVPNAWIQGYELNTARYPGGTIGTFSAANPPTFNFYYKPLSNTTTTVHYYKPSDWPTPKIYAYYTGDDGQIVEPLGIWDGPKSVVNMKVDTATNTARGETGWYIKENIPGSAFYVMFHVDNPARQIPGAGEQGYPVSGEAWIKDGIVQFNCTVVTSHIDMATGKQISADVVKNNTSVRSDQTYTTTANTSLNREYYTPANATAFYTAGTTNVVYLYKEGGSQPTEPTQATQSTEPVDGGVIGDADLDGKVTVLDATAIQRDLASIKKLTAAQLEYAIPCDSDEKLSILDATYIQSYLASVKRDHSRVGERVGVLPTSAPTSAPVTDAPTEYIPTYGPTPGEEITLYFSNSLGWSDVYAHIWNDDGGLNVWPGDYCDYVGTNTYNQGIYSFTVNTAEVTNIIFNDGNDTGKTVDIDIYPGMQNGIYPTGDPDAEGAYDVGYYDYDPNPGPGPGPSTGAVYLEPDIWNVDTVRYAAYFFADETTYQWVNMKFFSNGVYSADIPEGYDQVIFVRMNGATSTNVWENKWNQTEDLDVMDGSTYHITGWGPMGGNSEGYWD